MVIFDIPFILICNWIKQAEIVKKCGKHKFQKIYTTHKRLFASFQNSVKKAMLFRPTNQLNVKETKGVVH